MDYVSGGSDPCFVFEAFLNVMLLFSDNSVYWQLTHNCPKYVQILATYARFGIN